MKLWTIKQNFYKYISKTEYAMAFSIVFGSLGTKFVNDYSKYLSDRNKRIERINKQPLNHIWVDYITYEQYLQMIDRKNWKPSAMRNIAEQQDDKSIINKDTVINSVNNWLVKQTKKENNTNEVNPDSLRQLSEMQQDMNMQSRPKVNDEQNINKENNIVKKNDYVQTESISKIGELSNSNNKTILPPGKQKESEKQKYFVVQEAGGYSRYDPSQFKKNNKKQNIELMTKNSKQKVGKIAGKEIEKDESVFQSLAHIWRSLIYKDVKKYGQVIDSRFDQYGNRIKITPKKKKVRNNKTPTVNNDTMKEEKELIKSEQQQSIRFINPTITIDGNLQQISDYNNFQQIAVTNNITAIYLKALSKLEYTFESCWYQKYRNKYGNNFADAILELHYNKNKQIIEIKILNIDKNLSSSQQKEFIQDITTMMTSCKIEDIQNLNTNNYNMWGKITIQFLSKK